MRFHAADRPLGRFFSFVAVSAATLFAALAATVAEAHPLSTGVTGTVSPPAASSIIVPVKSFKCRLVDGWPECGWFGNKAKHESSDDDEDRPRKHKKKNSGSGASSDDDGNSGASKAKKKNADNDDSTGKKADDGGTGNKKTSENKGDGGGAGTGGGGGNGTGGGHNCCIGVDGKPVCGPGHRKLCANN